MDLIDRYLGAVRWNLPSGKADDILAELADLIAARIEDREEALDRPLRRDEVSQLLREFGHPLSVAGEYHGRRTLIGPEVFPFYWFALRIVLAVVAIIEGVQIAGRIVASDAPFMRALMQGLTGATHSLLVNAALVTLVFAVIERTGWLADYLERWKPEELPVAPRRLQVPKRRHRNPMWESLSSLAFGAAFLLWWFGGFSFPIVPHDARLDVQAAPVWVGLFWPVVGITLARMAYALVTLLNPAARLVRGALLLACTLGSLAVLAVLHQAGRVVVVTAASGSAARAAEVQAALDKGLGIAVIAVAIVTGWACIVELWQLFREER